MRSQRKSTVLAQKKRVYNEMVRESRVCYPCKRHMSWKQGIHFTDGNYTYCLDCVSMWHYALYKRLIPTCVKDGDKHLKRYLMQLRKNSRNVWRIVRRSRRLNLAGAVQEKKFNEIKNYVLCDTCAESSD